MPICGRRDDLQIETSTVTSMKNVSTHFFVEIWRTLAGSIIIVNAVVIFTRLAKKSVIVASLDTEYLWPGA